MRKIWIYLFALVLLSGLFYYLTILFLPNAIYLGLQYRLKKQRNLSENELIYMPTPTDESRSVVMPNPDFLYVASFYDVSKKPLQLTGDMPDSTYWSVALYQPNTINWYIKNDMEYRTDQLNLMLANETQALDTNTEIARSPVDKGFMLIRILVTDNSPETLAKYETWQKSIRLETIDD